MVNYKTARTPVLLLLIALCSTSRCSADVPAAAQVFLKTFCISCHGEEKPKAGLRLDQIDMQRWEDASLLEDIYTALESGEMPPKAAAKHPDAGETKLLQKILGNQLRGLAEKQKPGMLKRLSRTEYQNTINDVFGTEFSLRDRLPLDNIDAGFDNNADKLHLSVVDMEAYFHAANWIAESVVSDKPAPRVVVYSTKHTDIDSLSHKDNTDGFAPSLERDSAPLVFASPATQIKINPSVTTSGVYRVVPQGFYITAQLVRGSRTEERLPAVTNVSDSDIGDTPSAGHSMSYFLRKNSGVGQSIVTVINKKAAWRDFDPSEGFTTRLSSDDTIVLRCNSVKGSGLQRMFCIEKATITGPVYESWPPKTPFYTDYCRDIDAAAGYEACQVILKRLAERLFRRPVSEAELVQALLLRLPA